MRQLTLAELARLMIVLSDNVATNALIALLGFDAVNGWCERAGLAQTRLQRRMMDAAARGRPRHFTSAGDTAAALGWLLRGDTLPAPLRAFGSRCWPTSASAPTSALRCRRRRGWPTRPGNCPACATMPAS